MNTNQAAAPASAKQSRIIEAAIGVFLRYGHARTTMGDIAEAAGISRPALYLVFPRKDDIFAAAIARISETSLQGLRAALPRYRSLARKLHFCCESWGGHGYDVIAAHPDAKDLFDVHFAAVRQMDADFAALLATLLEEPLSKSRFKTSANGLARVLIVAIRGFADNASNSAEMRQWIALEVDLVLAAIAG